MPPVLDRPPTTAYAPPALEPLGTLRTLTKGAGPGAMPIVLQSVIIPLHDAEPARAAAGIPRQYQPPALEPLGTLRTLTKGAGPGGMPIVMQTGSGIMGGATTAGAA